MRAYMLIQTYVGQAGAVAERLRLIGGVKAAEHVSGPYDVIAVTESDDMDALALDTLPRVQAVDGITRTVTCPVVHL